MPKEKSGNDLVMSHELFGDLEAELDQKDINEDFLDTHPVEARRIFDAFCILSGVIADVGEKAEEWNQQRADDADSENEEEESEDEDEE